ncbi:type II secretion system F family protein [Roseiconus lacunae]|uniref:type II secretion system F family protein n=1 Tax=Roseiconus lacunae TaxID=2605694 RepID=UPI003088E190|nr:type II secretion system F family protein [Stieleria sp. HD01]
MAVESVKERPSRQLGKPLLSVGRIRLQYKAQLTFAIRELATLLQAGIPLLVALDSILAQSRGGFYETMLSVREKVANGEALGIAMKGAPHVFDEMTIGMISVGEHAGNLDEVCEQVADFRERANQLKDRIVSAMLYPIIIFAVSVGVTVFLMTVVVPMLLQNLIEIGRPLPVPTMILKWASDLLLHHGAFAFAAMSGVAVIGMLYGATSNGRQKIDRVALAMPVAGTLVQKQSLSRMALVVGTLLKSGIELMDALEIAERVATNRPLKTALAEMQVDLKNGRSLSDACERHSVITNAMSQVFSLGQQSGQLEKMLLRIGNDYDRQSELLANRLTTIIEPALLLFLSLMVGFVLFATVLPILEAGNVLAG